MRIKVFIISISLAVLLTALTGCVGSWSDFILSEYRYKYEDSFSADLEGIDEVSITIINGPISVETWDGNKVEIEVHERIKASSEEKASELAEAVKLEGERLGSKLKITLDYGDFYKLRKKYYCALDIKVPARLSLSLETTNGEMNIDEMEGSIKAETTNGDVGMDGCGGDADLKTTNGKIRASNVNGELRASSTNGSLKLAGYGEYVKGYTTNGNVSLVLLGAMSGDVELGTTNGGIELTIHPESSFELEARTTNGSVRESLSRTKFDGEFNRRHTRLDGEYGKGGHYVKLHTTNGSITIEEEDK